MANPIGSHGGILASTGGFHAEHARWNETLADLTKLIELQPERMDCWYKRCLARLSGGQVDEYRQDCGEMLQRVGQTDNAGDHFFVAWACVLAPDATTDWATAVALAEKSVQGDPQSAMCLNALGAVLYRAGRFDEALVRLSEAAALVEQTGAASNLSPAYPWFFLAMTQHRLGHAEEAKQWLDKAVTWTDKALADADQGTTDLPWNRRLTLKLLRDEATTLLGVTSPTTERAPEPAGKMEEAQELPQSAPHRRRRKKRSHRSEAKPRTSNTCRLPAGILFATTFTWWCEVPRHSSQLASARLLELPSGAGACGECPMPKGRRASPAEAG